MPITTAKPLSPIQAGQADILLTQTDVLRNNPQLLGTFFKANGSYIPWHEKLGIMGMRRAVQGPITEHYEEPRERRTFTVGSVVTASTGVNGQIVIALSANDMQAIVDDTGTTRYYSRPRVTETVQFTDKKNYKIVAKDTTTNPAVHRLTIKAIGNGVDPGTAIIANAKAFIIAPSKGEATGQVKSTTSLYFKYQNRFAIIDETALVSGTAMTTKSPLAAIEGQPGYWYIKDQKDATVRHEKQKSLMLLFGQLGSGNVTQFSPDFDTNVPVRDTEGAIAYALTAGFDKQYGTLADYDEDEFYEIAAYFRAKFPASNDLVAWQGYGINQRLEKLFKNSLNDKYVDYISKTFMRNAATSFRNKGMSETDMFLAYGFYGIRAGGYNFVFAQMEEFNDPEVGGLFDYPNWQIVMPMSMTKDAKTKAAMPYMGYEYRGQDNGGYSRENEVWKTGGAGPIQKTDEFDVNRSYLRSEVALHCANGELMVVNRPTPV